MILTSLVDHVPIDAPMFGSCARRCASGVPRSIRLSTRSLRTVDASIAHLVADLSAVLAWFNLIAFEHSFTVS